MKRSARKSGKTQEHTKKIRGRFRRGPRRELFVESLERRVLLAITPSYSNGTLRFTDPANLSDNLTLEVSAGYLDYSADAVNYTQLESLSELNSIVVQLGDGGDTLSIDPTLSDVLASDKITINDVGGTGQNTLASLAGAADPANTWNLTAPGTGILDGQISFTKVDSDIGGDGTDTFVIGTGMGSQSQVTIAGGGGAETLDYSAYSGNVAVNLAAGTATGLAGISGINDVVFGSGNNTFIGDANVDTVTVGSGNSTLTDGTGNDTFVFNADVDTGDDTINDAPGGADGVNTLDFSPTQTTGVTVNLNDTTAQAVTSKLSLTLSSASVITDVIGGGGNDRITANALTDTISPGSGYNTLIAGSGSDTFAFNADVDSGNDFIEGTPGGSGGVDAIDFSATGQTGVDVDLSSTVAQTISHNLAGQALNLILEPGNTVDYFTGGAGNDTVVGNSADDVLSGGPGTNTYVIDADAAAGNPDHVDSILSSEGGIDALDFAPTQQSPITLNLSTEAAQTVNPNLTLILSPGGLISNVIGGQGANTITGNALDNVFTAGPGDNSFTPGAAGGTLILNADIDRGSEVLARPPGRVQPPSTSHPQNTHRLPSTSRARWRRPSHRD